MAAQHVHPAADPTVLERVIVAELRAAAALRRAVGSDACPLVPPGSVARFRALQEATGEHGPAWARRVDQVLAAALAHRQPADAAAVALVRARVL